jgi:predicted branched-subunit amino acid permease
MTLPASAPLRPTRDVVVTALPVAAAIAVFGVLYGAAARPVLGGPLAVVSSLVVFSGAAQFTLVALLAAGAAPLAVLGGVVVLSLRHLPLGALVRPRLDVGRGRRAALSWFLIDETAGLAVAGDGPADRTLAVSGALAYGAWVLGTVAGVLGATSAAVEPLADALFPVLFVGLAALTARTRPDTARAVLAGTSALLLLTILPAAGAIGAIVVAVLVAAVVTAP